MKLSIVIVDTNEGHVLRPCLRSIFEQTKDIDFEVIVVDNASTDGSREMIEAEFPQVELIVNSENLGFSAGNNRGIKWATGDYVLLLNPDTEVLNGALQKTVRYMDDHPNVGVCGCKLWFPDGTTQRSVRSFPTVWNIFCETTFLYLVPWFKLTRQYTLSDFDYDSERAVDWVSGAFLMIRREVLDKIGGLDEQFYMYSDEVDYCYRTWQVGYEVRFMPYAEVIHHWGGVSKPTLRVMLWGHAGQMLFFQKHFRGIKKYSLIILKYVGIVIRVVMYFIVGCASFNKRLVMKACYSLISAYKLMAKPWIYRHNFTGKVIPWTRR